MVPKDAMQVRGEWHRWRRTKEMRALVEVATWASKEDVIQLVVATLAEAFEIKAAFVCKRVDAERLLARTLRKRFTDSEPTRPSDRTTFEPMVRMMAQMMMVMRTLVLRNDVE